MRQVSETAFGAAGSMERLCELLQTTGMGPGWNKPEPSLWPFPRKTFVPAHWEYSLAKPALDAAGLLVDTVACGAAQPDPVQSDCGQSLRDGAHHGRGLSDGDGE